MKTGIVLNISGEGRAQILQTGGKVITVRAREGWKCGDLILLKHRKLHMSKLFAAVCAAAVVCCLIFGAVYFKEAAVISLDVNPSMELVVNRFQRVIKVRALNEEGERILAGMKVKYKPYTEVLTDVLNKMELLGYLQKTSSVVLTVWSEDSDREEKLLKQLRSTPFSQTVDGISEFYPVDEKIYQSAQNCGVTAGKYIYLEELKTVNPEIAIKDYSNLSIEELKREIELSEENTQKPPIEAITPEPEITLEPTIEPEITQEPENLLDPDIYEEDGCKKNRHNH